MPRRKELKNIAFGIAGRFASRNTDIDGYWALGVLYSMASAAGTDAVHLDLVTEIAEPSFQHATRLLSQCRQYLQGRVESVDLEGYVVAATIDIEFNVEPQWKFPFCRTTWGDPFHCCVTLTDELGKNHKGTARGWCGKHDATREHRSNRALA